MFSLVQNHGKNLVEFSGHVASHTHTHIHFKKLRKIVALLLKKLKENVLELSEFWATRSLLERGKT